MVHHPELLRVLRSFLGGTCFLATAVQSRFDQVLGGIAEGDVSFSQLKLLVVVSRAERGTITDLAHFLGVSNAAAGKAVDRLVRRGLLCRSPALDDRRAALLSPTASGWDLLERFEAATNQAITGLLVACTIDELRAAEDVLDRVSIALVRDDAQPHRHCSECGILERETCRLEDALEGHCFFQEPGRRAEAHDMEHRTRARTDPGPGDRERIPEEGGAP